MTEEKRLNPTAEESVIGCLLLRPEIAGDALVQLDASDFRPGRYRSIFEAIRALYNEQKPIDPVLIADRLGEDFWEAINTCMELTPTAVNWQQYIAILREKSELSRLHDMARRVLDARDIGDARRLVDEAQAAAMYKPGVVSVSLMEMMADFYKRIAGPKPEYVRWGLGMLDDMLQTGKGKYILIGARPSTGKTALALQLGINIAQTQRVGFFSLETVPEIAADRIASARLSSMDLPRIKRHSFDQSDLVVASTQIGKAEELRGDFEFISASSLTVAEIRTITLAKRFDVIFIDYVQLIQPVNLRADRAEQMQRVSMELRAMAQLTGVVVVGLAQLRRPDNQKAQKAATMADLKESGQFEQDADSILLMYHVDPDNRRSDRWIKIDKNKEGPAGFASRFRFDGAKQTFIPVDRDGKAYKADEGFREADEQMEMEEIPQSWK